MIDKRLGEKPIKFEISIGNYGNTMDGRNESVKQKDSSDEEGEEEKDEEQQNASTEPEWHSTTDPFKPLTSDRFYYYLPYDEDKPCLWVKGMFEDHRRRMFNSNIVEKIIDKLVRDREIIIYRVDTSKLNFLL